MHPVFPSFLILGFILFILSLLFQTYFYTWFLFSLHPVLQDGEPMVKKVTPGLSSLGNRLTHIHTQTHEHQHANKYYLVLNLA